MFNFSKQVSRIPGWLTKSEAEFLYSSAKNLSKNAKIVEIGSWKGRSTICFGLGSKDGNKIKIYAIDPHTGSSEHKKWFGKVDTYKEFLENVKNAKVSDLVIPIKKTSENAVSDVEEDINFVLVDGAHEYTFVKKDYELWFPKLVNGGTIAFHDCWHAIGVHYLTSKLLLTSSRVKDPRLIDTLTTMEKCKQNNLFDRFYNFLFVIYRLFFGWIGTLKMDFTGTIK
jgi:predicted O-methyltransferase YrrM